MTEFVRATARTVYRVKIYNLDWTILFWTNEDIDGTGEYNIVNDGVK